MIPLEDQQKLIHTYMRYSKRIVVIALIQWIVVAIVVFVFMGIVMNDPDMTIDEYVSGVLRGTVTASSSLATVIGVSYYGHSIASDWVEGQTKKMLHKTTFDDKEPDENG